MIIYKSTSQMILMQLLIVLKILKTFDGIMINSKVSDNELKGQGFEDGEYYVLWIVQIY